MREEILKKLDERLDEYMEVTGKHIAASRRDVLYEFKEKGIIKDYKRIYNWDCTQPYNKYIFKFGSCVGFDSMYKVILKKEA